MGSQQTAAHPDFESEQAFLRHAHARLLAMHDRVKALGDAGADPKASAALMRERQKQLEHLQDPESVLFGRLNFEAGEEFYLGPQAVREADDKLIVVNWAAPAVKPFYDATPSDPQGLTLRRRFQTRREQLLGIADEWLAEPGAEPTIDDILLDELGRERTGEMRQIAATIQRDQYRIIERPLESTTVVQGGPGTGKTVVGLHRAALLLYRQREQLTTMRVLIVGPNRLFMQYIAYVLPSLGETAADQVAVENLVDIRVVEQDDGRVALVKGDERMAEVMRRTVLDRVRPPAKDIEFRADGIVFSVPADVVVGFIGDFDPRERSYVNARLRFRAAFEREAGQAYATAARRRAAVPARSVREMSEFERALDRIWPTISAADLVRQFLSSEERIERAGSGILGAAEQRLLYRKPVERIEQVRWTASDLPLVDEVQELLDPTARRYGHVILDEAQDLTPMQLRMVGRRIADGAVTVLGDLAQATGLWAYSTWEEVAEHLGVADTVEIEELTYAYRVPAEIMEVALPVLQLTAPAIAPPIPYRRGGEAPTFSTVGRKDRHDEAITRVRAAQERGGTVAIIVPPSLLQSLREALKEADLEFGDAERGELATTIELLEPTASKGLEFDHVVLVEPAAIIREAEGQGQRDLYVALTRATRTLACVHSEPLPWPLGERQLPSPAVSTPVAEQELPRAEESSSDQEATDPASSADAPALSLDESLAVAQMRHMDIDDALVRALLVRAQGGTDADIARAVLDPTAVELQAVAAVLSTVRGKNGIHGEPSP